MVSSDTARLGIVRRAKFPSKPPLIRYKDARAAVTGHLASATRSLASLNAARVLMQQKVENMALSSLVRDDAAHSIEVLDAIVRMANQLGPYDFQPPPTQQPKLTVAGLEVSVRADLIVHGTSRAAEQIGAAVLRLTMDASANEAAIERRRNMGLYVATLARMHVESLRGNREPANRLCMSIDVQHGEVFVAPNANTRRLNDLEAACAFIVAMWPTIV